MPSPQRTISVRFFPTRSPFPRTQLPLPVRDFLAVTTTTLGCTHGAGDLGCGFTNTAHATHTSRQGFTQAARAARCAHDRQWEEIE
jgi:hypothetical protein